MGPKGFVPPKNQAELEQRAAEYTRVGANAMLKTLKQQRANMVRSIDAEIKFFEQVVELKGGKA